MSDQGGLVTGGAKAASQQPQARRTVQERSPEVEVVTVEQPNASLALYQRGTLVPSEAPPVQALAMMDNALQVAERMAQVVASLRTAAIKMTDHADWVLSRDRQGVELGMLTASGAQKVNSLYGVVLEPINGGTMEPQPIQVNGKKAFTLQCTATARLLGRRINIEATRSEGEDFTGRETDDKGDLKFNGGYAYEPDLKKSVRTLAETTSARELIGLKNVSRQELDAAWSGTQKTADRCRFGHGYGTSQDRSAAGVAEGDVGAKAEALRVDLLRRVSGDEDAAKKLLGEITVDPNGKFAKTSVKQFTQGWQVDKAAERLRAHQIFGDKARAREPGQD
jgi:hypothetical protein